jgi:hypothetical protein
MADNIVKMEQEFAEKASDINEKQNKEFSGNFTNISEGLNSIIAGENGEEMFGKIMQLEDGDFNIISELILDQTEKSLKEPKSAL